MRRVGGVLPLNFRHLRRVHVSTWACALGVVALSVAAALAAQLIAAWSDASAPHLARLSPAPSVATIQEPIQTPNRAKKAAREPMRQQARLAPELPLPAPVEAALPAPRTAEPLPEADANANPEFQQTGRASWYQLPSPTANGERMQAGALTAAHPSLPFGSKVKVANLDNGREVVVRINDRGPFAKNRIIDVSKAAAARLGMVRAGVARVSVSLVETELASNEEPGGETLR